MSAEREAAFPFRPFLGEIELLPWPQRWWMAEAEASIGMGLSGWSNDPKVCGLVAIKWLRKALS